MSFGASASMSVVPNFVTRARRRFVGIRPVRFRMPPIVLDAGKSSPQGSPFSSHALSFFGPHVGCSSRASITSFAMSALVA